MLKRPALLVSTVLLSACTASGWYAGMQSSHKLSCRQLPDSEYRNCLKENDQSYRSYQKTREQLEQER